MNTIFEIGFPTLILAAFIYFLCATIWGDMAERTYDSRMNSSFSWFLMPGPLKNKTTWIKMQKGIACAAIPFVSLIYGLIVHSILWKQ